MPLAYLLPGLGARLRPCAVPGAALAPAPGGHHCNQCQCLVHDFTRATAADVARAHATAPDGRLCGRFRAGQARSGFTRRLRWFATALVLVLGQGLTARQALAQVRHATPKRPAAPPQYVYGTVEQMPEYKAGGQAGMMRFILKHLRYPAHSELTAGTVYAEFTIDAVGKVRNPQVLRGNDKLLNTEIIRVLRLLGDFKPGTQNGRPVAVLYTLPISCLRPQ